MLWMMEVPSKRPSSFRILTPRKLDRREDSMASCRDNGGEGLPTIPIISVKKKC